MIDVDDYNSLELAISGNIGMLLFKKFPDFRQFCSPHLDFFRKFYSEHCTKEYSTVDSSSYFLCRQYTNIDCYEVKLWGLVMGGEIIIGK